MMSLKTAIGGMILAAAALTVGQAFAEPTIDQVYQAAEAGNFSQAQQMMGEVLRAHPNSAKAHYVEAELLARQGRVAAARDELRTAERLEPGLPFARAQAVQDLQRRIGGQGSLVPTAPTAAQGISLNTVLLGGALLVLVFIVIRALRARSARPLAPGGGAPYGSTNSPAAPYGSGPAAPMTPAGGGLGSGILGGLATGAALGAGVVAGEALAHRLGEGAQRNPPPPGLWGDNDPSGPDDMGGNDFGISDGSSWDDAGGGDGGSDWN